ncbi:nitronate monooxygenase, partial [Cyanobacteria bacterium FACHB-63]|nr:nitronate monooxygenase [Cyanobacteria bacterium FACHB-63]
MNRILPALRIGQHIARYPIIQGAMAVRVSGANLAGAVANAGGIGLISSLGIGLASAQFNPRRSSSFFAANRSALIEELQKARMMSPNGVIGVNILVATRDYLALAQTAAAHGADVIVTGAGLPLQLPEATVDYPNVALIPIVADVQAAKTICETWLERYDRAPDAFIVENCKQIGGHFASQCEESNTETVQTVIAELRNYLTELGLKLPLIVSGGIWDREDIDRAIAMGANGVQIGTRFITTEECDADRRYKEFYLQAHPQNVVTVPSPAGKPGRALHNEFAKQAMTNAPTLERRCIANCLSHCLCRDTGKTYCLLQALSKASQGDVEQGLI